MPLLSISSPSYVAVARRRTAYRGGFRSSICDLFSNSSRRADFCSLACCGILQSDKNRYLLNGESPSWCKRLTINFGLPLVALILIAAVAVLVTNKDKDDSHQSQSAGTGYAFLAFLLTIVAVCTRGHLARMRLRREVMRRIYERRESEADTTEAFLSAQNGDICCAEMTCCGCYSNDVTYTLDNSFEEDFENVPQPDFCARLFQSLGLLCCGACCQCFCQCCGMCAIGQEEREISALVPKDRQLIDYITFEVCICLGWRVSKSECASPRSLAYSRLFALSVL